MKGQGQSHRFNSLGSREAESGVQDVYRECPWDQHLWKEGEGSRIGRGEVKLQYSLTTAIWSTLHRALEQKQTFRAVLID